MQYLFSLMMIGASLLHCFRCDVFAGANVFQLLDVYASAVSNFTQCALFETQEFSKCRSCRHFYNVSRLLYEEITTQMDDATKNSCLSSILSDKELEAMTEVNRSVETSWTNSACQNCFMGSDASDSGKVNNMAENFFHHFSVYYDCILNYTQVPFNLINVTCDGLDNCSVCRNSYENLKTSYQDLKVLNISACADITDLMNASHILWNLSCYKRGSDVVSMVIVAAFACVPCVFYISTTFRRKRPQRTIIRQKRLETVLLVNDAHLSEIQSVDEED